MKIKQVCIASASPASYGLARFELGEFRMRDALDARHTYKGQEAVTFAASRDALITWNPLHKDVVRAIRDRNPNILIGPAFAVEAITATPHGDPPLDLLRNVLLPLCYKPPVDYFAGQQPLWPAKPHAMAVDFEHRSGEVFHAVTRFFRDYVRPLEPSLVFLDSVHKWRYWGAAPNVPPTNDVAYRQLWIELIAWIQAHVAPVWSHNSGVDSWHSGRNRVEEHFFRLSQADRIGLAAVAFDYENVLIRSGEWRDVRAIDRDVIRKEMENALGTESWIVNARSGGAFGLWSI